MKHDDKCTKLMEHVEDVIKLNMDEFVSVNYTAGIEIRTEKEDAQPWDTDKSRVIKIDALKFGVALAGLEQMQGCIPDFV